MIDKRLIEKESLLNRSSSYSLQNEERRIKLTNYISFISLFSGFIFIAYYSLIGFLDLQKPIIILCFSFPVFLIPVFLNKKKLHLAAKLLLASFSSVLTVFICLYYLGKEPGVHVFLLVFGIIPFFIWSSKQYVYTIAFFIINILCFVYIELFNSPFPLHLVFPVEYISQTRGFSILISFIGATAAIVIFHDLANKKENLLHLQNEKIEQQKILLQKLNTELNKKVEELTTQQEELNQSNMVRSKIYTVIGHDLRSPISSMNALLDLIVSEYENINTSELRRYINSLHSTSKNSYALLENLLDWSRMHSSRIKLNNEKLNLNRVALKALQLNKDLLDKKQIHFNSKIDNKQEVFADRYILSTIFRNLLSNAIKFTPHEGAILINSIQHDNKLIEISISDSGIGMTPKQIEKLFKMEDNFIRVGTDNEKGSGLGLIICKEFIEKNNGTLSIESVKGKGSIFSFTVPSA